VDEDESDSSLESTTITEFSDKSSENIIIAIVVTVLVIIIIGCVCAIILYKRKGKVSKTKVNQAVQNRMKNWEQKRKSTLQKEKEEA